MDIAVLPMGLTIRNIQRQDKLGISSLIDMVNQVDKLGYSITGEWLEYVIEKAGEGIFVGYCNDELVGLATCMINPVASTEGTVSVVIHPDYRLRGFGTSLYSVTINHAIHKGVKHIEAYVKKRLDHAMGFAQKRDFATVLYSWQMELELKEVNLSHEGNENVVFRKSVITDSPAYAAIINECFGDEMGADALQQLLKDPSVKVYMLEKEGQIIGSTTVQVRENISLGYIYDVAMANEFRGQGLGSYMLKQCISELKDNNIEKASLLVAGENKNALAMYKRLGFKEVDTDIVMQKSL